MDGPVPSFNVQYFLLTILYVSTRPFEFPVIPAQIYIASRNTFFILSPPTFKNLNDL